MLAVPGLEKFSGLWDSGFAAFEFHWGVVSENLTPSLLFEKMMSTVFYFLAPGHYGI